MNRISLVVLVLVLAAAASSAAVIPNGKFNSFTSTYFTTSIPSWTVGTDEAFTEQSGVFFVIDGVSATSGAMVILTNAPDGGSVGSTDVTTLTSSPFTLTEKRIEFKYVYVTGETASDAGDGYDDPFSVSVVRTSDSAVLYDSVVATAADLDLVHSNVNYGPLAGTDNRGSDGWQLYRIDALAWLGEEVRVVFTIQDAVDDGVNSGVFLEDVLNTPEPGALVLFGLGAAGVGLWRVRRRRR